MKKKEVIVYASYIPKVGGIETITYNLIKLLSTRGFDVTLVYSELETDKSLVKFLDYADVVKAEDYIITGDICIICSNYKLPQNIHAKKYIQWIHSDYNRYSQEDGLANADKKIEYVAVSKHCAKVFEKLYNIKPAVIHNFPDEDVFRRFTCEPPRVVFCTVTRLSREKGRLRMLWLCKKLRELNIKFLWLVVGDNSVSAKEDKLWRDTFKDYEEVSFVGYKNDPSIYMKCADYTVLLSDFEGCPLALLECLSFEKPVITTNWGGADEIVKEGTNGYILPLDIERTDDKLIKKIVQNRPHDFEIDFEPTKQKWVDLLNKL